MKQLKSLFYVAFIAFLAMGFASCDEDACIAYSLDGTWKGTTRVSKYDVYTSTVRFFQEDNYGGYGYEYSRQGWSSDYCDFEWEVRQGNIYLYYEDGFDAVIYDYHLSDGVLYGEITDRCCGWNRADISWTKVGNNWDRGYNTYYSKKKENLTNE